LLPASLSIELLQKNGLPHSGKKDELVERLVSHDEHKALELESLEAEFGSLEEFDESKLNLE
jgi:SAP domain-containing ribonucleoprotein